MTLSDFPILEAVRIELAAEQAPTAQPAWQMAAARLSLEPSAIADPSASASGSARPAGGGVAIPHGKLTSSTRSEPWSPV